VKGNEFLLLVGVEQKITGFFIIERSLLFFYNYLPR